MKEYKHIERAHLRMLISNAANNLISIGEATDDILKLIDANYELKVHSDAEIAEAALTEADYYNGDESDKFAQ